MDVRTTARPKPADEGGSEGLLNPDQLAEYLGLGRTYTYELLRTGEIRSFKIGKLRRVRREDVDEYVRTLLNEQRH